MSESYSQPTIPRLAWQDRDQPKPRLRMVEQKPPATERPVGRCELVFEEEQIGDINAVLRHQREIRQRLFGEPARIVLTRTRLLKPQERATVIYPMKFGPFKPKPPAPCKIKLYPYVFGPRQHDRDWIIIEPKVTMAAIIDAVCAVYLVGKLDLLSHRRTRNLTMPRQVAMYVARVYTDLSFPQIARLLGKEDHTTAIYGYSQIKSHVENDAQLASQVATVKSMAGIK